MVIKKFYSAREKAGWRWDAAKKKFSSWGFDIWLADGRRKRESGFASKQIAESAAARIRLGEKNRRYELVDRQTFPALQELFQKRIETINQHAEKMRAVRVLQTLLECLAEKGFSSIRVNELTTAQINLYVER
jgi:hypothetical protein